MRWMKEQNGGPSQGPVHIRPVDLGKGQKPFVEEGHSSQQMVWSNWTSTCKNLNLHADGTLSIKINSKWTKVKCESQK